MTYYELNPTAEPTITGAYPQLNLVDYADLEKMQDLDHKTFISSTEDLAELKFTKETIVTDLLTCGHINVYGFAVSENFKNLIEKLVKEGIKTTPFQFVPLTIKKSESNYYVFQFIPDHNIIDYNNTIFTNLRASRREEKIENHSAYNPALRLKNLKLKTQYDILLVPYRSEILISKKVKEVIQKNNITGISKIESMILYNIN